MASGGPPSPSLGYTTHSGAMGCRVAEWLPMGPEDREAGPEPIEHPSWAFRCFLFLLNVISRKKNPEGKAAMVVAGVCATRFITHTQNPGR